MIMRSGFMYISKSKYCNGVQCKKMLWLDKYCYDEKGEVDNQSILDNGADVGILAKDLFGDYIDIEFNFNIKKFQQDLIINNLPYIDVQPDLPILLYNTSNK